MRAHWIEYPPPLQVPSSDADSGAQLDQGMPDIQPLALDQMLGAETTLPQQPSAEDAPPHAPLPEAVLFKEFQQAQQEQQSKGSAQLAASPPPAEETGANADMASSPAHVSPPPAACPDTELQQAAFGTPFAAASPMLASPIPSAAATAEPAAQQLDASFAAAAAAGQPQGEAEAPAAAPQVQLTPVNSDGLRGTATKVLSGSTRRTPGLVPRRAVASPTPAPATNPPSSARVQSARVSATPTMAVNAVSAFCTENGDSGRFLACACCCCTHRTRVPSCGATLAHMPVCRCLHACSSNFQTHY